MPDTCPMSLFGTLRFQKVSALNPHLLRHDGAAARHGIYHTDVRLAAPCLSDAKDQIRMNSVTGEHLISHVQPFFTHANHKITRHGLQGTQDAPFSVTLQIERSLVRSQLVSLEFFIDIKSFRSHYGPGVDSASNRNEYQEHFLGVKAAGA